LTPAAAEVKYRHATQPMCRHLCVRLSVWANGEWQALLPVDSAVSQNAGRATSAEPGAISVPARRSSRLSLPECFCLVLTLSCAVLVTAPIVLGLEADPRGYGTHEQLGLPPCLIMKFTRFPCPTCGLTTAVALAARFRLGAALVAHPFGFILYVGACAVLAWNLVALATRRPATRILAVLESPWCWGGLIAAYFGSWGFRIIAIAAGA